ncbi:hypothetical protein ACO0SA_001635 [Hanseniaspora valbyensis]
MVKSLEVDDSVILSLRGFVASHENLKLLKADRVVYRSSNPKKPYIAVIAGGGSGHEPLHAGFVGENLLTAAVAGDVFASPSTKQILNAIKLANKDKNCKGVLLVIKNYTGDVLHFGLASERARSLGINCKTVVIGEDVSVNSKFVGRRALAGTALAHKIISAFAATQGEKYDVQDAAAVGEIVNKNMITIGAALDHCKVPGRKFESSLKENQMELGLGIHNEPGVETLEPIPSVKDLIEKKMLARLFKEEGNDKSFVDISPKDEVLLLVNNLGGLSNFAISSIVYTTLELLKKKYDVKPKIVLAGTYVTAFNSPGFSLTLLNLSNCNKSLKKEYGINSVSDLLTLETDAPGWSSSFRIFKNVSEYEDILYSEKDDDLKGIETDDIAKLDKVGKIDYKQFTKILTSACESLKKAEPHITHLDSQVGDGDCGYTLVNGCDAILKNLPEWESEKLSFSEVLHKLSEVIEDSMGGTQGGLYSIFISGCLAGALENAKGSSNQPLNSELLAASLNHGLDILFKYTKARAGDSTMIDSLEPFVRTFNETKGDFSKAYKAAEDGMNVTSKSKAKFGRASYVGDSSESVADPGSVGIVEFLKGASKYI